MCLHHNPVKWLHSWNVCRQDRLGHIDLLHLGVECRVWELHTGGRINGADEVRGLDRVWCSGGITQERHEIIVLCFGHHFLIRKGFMTVQKH